MATARSVSYSMTMRLDVGSHGRAVSEITRAVEHEGGVVTALDVNAAGHERGLLDAQSRAITDGMLVAAARALADVVTAGELGPNYIIPSVFHPDVASAVAAAVRAVASGQHPVRPDETVRQER
jgi:hypothetical protein